MTRFGPPLLLAMSCTVAHASPAPAPSSVSDAAAARESLATATELLSRGDLEIRRANFAAARPPIERALRIRESQLDPGDPAIARARSSLARVLTETGDYAKGVLLFRQAIEVLERPEVNDSTGLGLAFNGMGRLRYRMGNAAEARRALERALAIREAHHGPFSTEVRITLNNMANVLTSVGDLRGAKPIYERLVRLEETAEPPDSIRLAAYLNNLANAVSDLGEYRAGRKLYERALAIRERVHGSQHVRLATTLINLASLAEGMDEDDDALSYADRAIRIWETTLGEGHPLTAEGIASRGAVRYRLGDHEGAFQDGLRGERLTREHLRLTARSLSESDALAYEASRISGLDVVMTLLEHPGGADSVRAVAALDAVVRSRSVLLDEMAARHRAIAASGDSAAATLMSSWAEARSRFAELALQGVRAAADNAGYRRGLEAARRAAQDAEARLARRSAPLRREELEHRIGLGDVVAALPQGSALVSYVRYSGITPGSSKTDDHRYLAFVTRPDRETPAVIPLGSAGPIDSLASRWRTSVSRPGGAGSPRAAEAAYRRVAGALRARIWDSVAPALAGARQVFIVPDGSLHLVNFQTFPEARSRYLVETDRLFHYLSTERDLGPVREAQEPGGDLLAMGGVDFDNTEPGGTTGAAEGSAAYRGEVPTCDGIRKLRFQPLRGTEREVREISALWEGSGAASGGRSRGRARLLIGAAASEEEFKRAAPRCQAIHVATHGFFVNDECLRHAGDDEPEAWELNPLLRSGLVLAGANRHAAEPAGEDGLVTAEEIAALDLGNAEWVVLSACDTGVGTIVSGEGVLGLRRAFEIAGAGTLVMSLWNVGDAATRRWMRALYEARIIGGLSAAESVRQASRTVLGELRTRGDSTLPATWGAFIASGDWR